MMNETNNSKSYETNVQFAQVSEKLGSTSKYRTYSSNEIETYINKMDEGPKDIMSFVCHYVFAQAQVHHTNPHEQMSEKDAIRLFGSRAIDAPASEVAQFDMLEVFRGISINKLTTK